VDRNIVAAFSDSRLTSHVSARTVVMPPTDSHLLGPFIGNVTASTATIWLQIKNLVRDETRTVFVTLHEGAVDARAAPTIGVIKCYFTTL
jgi:hypothetical protein